MGKKIEINVFNKKNTPSIVGDWSRIRATEDL